ncbi:sulfurtransferase complex subunit TusB [Zobellella endophytica]|uniref:Sulfurtransferase complex subunit TusB n=1 Tax=Zobellella endophytica TaxID=2116700 RepID=A0A2P7QTR9_9GAMM|nr:sulfurtransferase complex subunit TusB [Zobellella endophytica]PSJ41351.1 sulfurtransferase complex subunit TusB [Zobellella endophytica]
MLHTVKQSPFGHGNLPQALCYMADEDRLLLWQDAVIAATVPAWRQRLQPLASAGRLYVMQEDLQARGLQSDLGQLLTMSELVALVAELGSPQAW